MSKAIKVFNPNGLPTIKHTELVDLQGDFKNITQREIEKLQNSILKHGIFLPKFVWEDAGVYWTLDGHQTKKALQGLEADYQVPEIPIVKVEAKDKVDAIEKLYIINSRYGKINAESDFVIMNEIYDELLTDIIEIPELNLLEMDLFKKDSFDSIVDQFDDGEKKSGKNSNWIFIQYYADDIKYKQVKGILKEHMINEHEVDSAWFHKLITADKLIKEAK